MVEVARNWRGASRGFTIWKSVSRIVHSLSHMSIDEQFGIERDQYDGIMTTQIKEN